MVLQIAHRKKMDDKEEIAQLEQELAAKVAPTDSAADVKMKPAGPSRKSKKRSSKPVPMEE